MYFLRIIKVYQTGEHLIAFQQGVDKNTFSLPPMRRLNEELPSLKVLEKYLPELYRVKATKFIGSQSIGTYLNSKGKCPLIMPTLSVGMVYDLVVLVIEK